MDSRRWWEDTKEDLRRFSELNLNMENINGKEKLNKEKPSKADKSSVSSSSGTQSTKTCTHYKLFEVYCVIKKYEYD